MEGVSNEFVQRIVDRLEKPELAERAARAARSAGAPRPQLELPPLEDVTFKGVLAPLIEPLGEGELKPLEVPEPGTGIPFASIATAPIPLTPSDQPRSLPLDGQPAPPLPSRMPGASLNLNSLKYLEGRTDEAALDEVSRQFESLFVYQLMKQMWDTVPENTLFGEGMAAETFRDMWMQEISAGISSSSNGIGLADVIKRDLLASQAEASRKAAEAAAELEEK